MRKIAWSRGASTCSTIFSLFLLSVTLNDSTGWAQGFTITPENISRFAGKETRDLGRIACYMDGYGDGLGQIWGSKTKKAQIPSVGTEFRPLSPSLETRFAKLNSDLTGINKKLRRTTKANAKARLRKKQSQVGNTIIRLQRINQWCSGIKNVQPPGTGNPWNPDFGPVFEDTRTSSRYEIPGQIVSGTVFGAGGEGARVTLGNDQWMESVKVAGGAFRFDDVPQGTYFVRVEAPGISFGPAHTAVVGGDPNQGGSALAFEGRRVTSTGFRYHWNEEVISRAGNEFSSASYGNTSEASEISSLASDSAPDVSAESALQIQYDITLSNDDTAWTLEHADRLLKTIVSVWDPIWGAFPVDRPSVWRLASRELPDDIEIGEGPDGSISVTVAAPAFVYAVPMAKTIDGVRGSFFSRRLYKAAARFVTRNGSDTAAALRILQNRFKVDFSIADPSWLTWNTTQEGRENFQEFSPSELMWLIASFAELPEGIAKASEHTFIHILRRKNSVPHPKFPGQPIVVWPGKMPHAAYIEFMYGAFQEYRLRGEITDEPMRVFRSIIEARALILWQHFVPDALKNVWIELGDWHYEPASDNWYTNNPTEVGLSYLRGNNSPGEDFASALSEYLAAPQQLQYRSPRRYEFIMQRIMHGYRYVREVRPDLRYEVLNLRPDYSYPGKIKSIDISVKGAVTEDKTVKIDITLAGDDLLNDGALYGWTVIKNKAKDGGGSIPVSFSAVDPDPETGLSLKFRSVFTISKYAASGSWEPDTIMFVDGVQNARIQNRDTFGWSLFIENPLYLDEMPKLVPGSTTLSLGQKTFNGQTAPTLIAAAQLQNPHVLSHACSLFRWLSLERTELMGCMFYGGMVRIEVPFSPYRPTDQIGISELRLFSKNLKGIGIYYSSNPKPNQELMPTVDWVSPNSDTTPPELGLNDIRISAQPLHPESPDGQTAITVSMHGRDDKSGLRFLSYCLKSPLDLYVCRSINGTRQDSLYYEGDPTAWKEYSETWVLPKGSAPGTWGLAMITVGDMASNIRSYDLTELIHFEVESNQ